MEQETLYTATKWDILKHLENNQLSPIELSEITGGSLANISAQLRLLEMAGLVKSERIPNRDKGMPRVAYSLAQDSCYVISTANSFVQKKRLPITPIHQIVLKIWFLDNPELRTFAEKAFWRVEEHLPDMQGLYIDTSSTKPLNLYYVADDALSIPSIQEIRHNDSTCQVTVTRLSKETLTEVGPHLLALYDSEN